MSPQHKLMPCPNCQVLQRSNTEKDEALRPFALYAQLNDLAERDPDSVIEVPVRDIIAASKALEDKTLSNGGGE